MTMTVDERPWHKHYDDGVPQNLELKLVTLYLEQGRWYVANIHKRDMACRQEW